MLGKQQQRDYAVKLRDKKADAWSDRTCDRNGKNNNPSNPYVKQGTVPCFTLSKRISQTGIKSISFSNQDDVTRLYVDAAAINSKVKGVRFEKCVELINVIAEADVLSDLSVQNGAAQYLLLARKTPYQTLRERFPLYMELEKLASNDHNHVILGPRP